jgi:hypothetical protein
LLLRSSLTASPNRSNCVSILAEANECSQFDGCRLGNAITRPLPHGKDCMSKHQNVSRKGRVHTEVGRDVYFGKFEAKFDAQHDCQSMSPWVHGLDAYAELVLILNLCKVVLVDATLRSLLPLRERKRSSPRPAVVFMLQGRLPSLCRLIAQLRW